MTTAVSRKLEAWVRSRISGANISPIAEAASGLSSDTYIFDIEYPSGWNPQREKLILRTAPKQAALFPDTDLETQFRLMRALGDTDLPIPAMRWFESDPNIIGSPFIVMEYVEGKVASDFPPGFHGQGHFFEATPARRAAMWWAALEQIESLHRIDWRRLALPELIGASQAGEHPFRGHVAQIERWMAAADIGEVPLITKGLAWLNTAPVTPPRQSLLWGDARPGNIIYKDDRVAALIDWELATIGPPEFDLFYLIYSAHSTSELYGTPWMPGLPGRDETVARYELLAGRPLDNALYSEVLSLVRMQAMIALGVRAAPKGLVYSMDFFSSNYIAKQLEVLMRENGII